jgi:hypothetical protein
VKEGERERIKNVLEKIILVMMMRPCEKEKERRKTGTYKKKREKKNLRNFCLLCCIFDVAHKHNLLELST